MKIALYARVSTKDKGQDTENQLSQLREYVAKSSDIIFKEYVDHVSGSGEFTRPKFDEMLTDASKRRFDVLLFWSLDRISREGVFVTLKHLDTITSYGIGWKSFTEQYLDSTGIFKDAVIGILATIAKQERIRLGERTKAGMQRAKAKGVRLGRKKVTDIGRLRKGKLIPSANLSELNKLKLEGKSLREITKLTGISKDSVRRLLSQKGESGAVA